MTRRTISRSWTKSAMLATLIAALLLMPASTSMAADAGAKEAKPLRIAWGPFLQDLTRGDPPLALSFYRRLCRL